MGGGYRNTNNGVYATVPGGRFNLADATYSLAAGNRAKALHQGAFVWADSQGGDFSSTGPDQFCIRAQGGVGINTAPSWPLDVLAPQAVARFITTNAPFGSVIELDNASLAFSYHGAINFNGGAGQIIYRYGDAMTFVTANSERMRVASSGNVGIGTNNPQANLHVNGTTMTGVLAITGGSDIAEPFRMSAKEIPQGSIVIIDEEHPGQLKPSERAYDTRVAGIVSGANGIKPGISLRQEGALEGGQNVALSGRVYALAAASNGPIKPGGFADDLGHTRPLHEGHRSCQGPGCGPRQGDERPQSGQGLGAGLGEPAVIRLHGGLPIKRRPMNGSKSKGLRPAAPLAQASRFPLFTSPFACWVAILLLCQTAQPAPFRDLHVPFIQPDGTRIEVVGSGDEFYAVFETVEGYTVVFDHALGAYCFARKAPDGQLISTSVQIHRGDPAALGLAPHERLEAALRLKQIHERRERWEQATENGKRWRQRKAAMHAAAAPAAAGTASAGGIVPQSAPGQTTTGTKLGLCLLVDFDDDPATIPQADIINFCNGDSYNGYGNNGSVKKYFQDVSNGLLTYSNVVTIYIRIPNSLHP